jgi:hypothetical protein
MSYISKRKSNIVHALTFAKDAAAEYEAIMALREHNAKHGWERPNEEEAADEVASSINTIGFDHDAFIRAMGRQHRTLQQTFTSVCLMWLAHLATLKPGQYDGRNEASVNTAKEIMAACEAKGLHVGRLPLV